MCFMGPRLEIKSLLAAVAIEINEKMATSSRMTRVLQLERDCLQCIS